MTNYAWCSYNIKAAVCCFYIVHFMCCVYSWSSVKVNGFKRRTPISVLRHPTTHSKTVLYALSTYIYIQNCFTPSTLQEKIHIFLLQQYFFISSWSHKECMNNKTNNRVLMYLESFDILYMEWWDTFLPPMVKLSRPP